MIEVIDIIELTIDKIENNRGAVEIQNMEKEVSRRRAAAEHVQNVVKTDFFEFEHNDKFENGWDQRV